MDAAFSPTLTLIWTGIIGFAVFMYVLMDGFDLGLGILFPFAPTDTDRDVMMNSVAPIWDFNETWLILGAAGLFAAFPVAYTVILPALYLPILFMLVALIFRGVTFEFRFKARTSRWLWDRSFHFGSLVATFMQGVALGTFIQGIPVEGRTYVGGPLNWLTPFSLLVGLALVFGYALLGATWLIWRSENGLQAWARSVTRLLLYAVLAFIVLVSLLTPTLHPQIVERWFSWPNILLLSPVPIVTAVLAVSLWRSAAGRGEVRPFILAMGLFLLSYIGIAVSLWPYLIPFSVTIQQAASPPETQMFLLVGMVFLIPTILVYTAYCYWVFRGKISAEGFYH
ncbi:MAG TPA: cytochrome d ubiquinol oxidase subunit II [Azospirillaceae bacterium]|nr:cytochrome d ubiquinol oxidase subunit II [Azospirillaceae bacterium]